MPTSAVISIVDDDPFVRKALQRLLRSTGYAVDIHSSGAELLQWLGDHRPDCIVLDLHMPSMNGFDVQVELRHRGIRVPVVVISGNTTPDTCARVLAAGAFAYICKPIDAADLLGAIHGALLSQRH